MLDEDPCRSFRLKLFLHLAAYIILLFMNVIIVVGVSRSSDSDIFL